jgi:alpha-D-ribose 1-methylphosphonate 5-triphosphate synthase subunit PhnG
LTSAELDACHQDFINGCFNACMNATHPNPERARWMALLAKSPPHVLSQAVVQYGALPSFTWLRRPEIGLAMVRGRTGGTGAKFNVGEMSVTRCALRLATGEMGVAYIAGRDVRQAEWAAIFDALMQSGASGEVSEKVLQPIEAALAQRRTETINRAQATNVEFMTMVRGEDA